MANKGRRTALGVFAIGKIAEAVKEQQDKKEAFNQQLGLLLLKQQQDRQEREAETAYRQDKLRLDLMGAMQDRSILDPLTGKPTGTVKGMGQDTIETQFPGVLRRPQTAPTLPPIDVGSKSTTVLPKPDTDLTRSADVKFKQQATNLENTLNQIRMLEDKYNKLSASGKTGLGVDTAGAYMSGKLGQDPDAKDYMSLKEGLTAFFGRNIGNDVGNFSEKEAVYYQNLTPGLFDNPESAKQQFQTIKDILNERKKVLYGTYGRNTTPSVPMSDSPRITRPLSKEKAKEFLIKANGNRALAEQMAIKEGYSF